MQKDSQTAKMRSPEISAVIATLGAVSIEETILDFKRGLLSPEEILICIPKENANKISHLEKIPGVIIVRTSVKGQVAQRAEGLSLAKGDMVLQCDDDIRFSEQTLNKLSNMMLDYGYGHVIGPIFCSSTTEQPIYKWPSGIKQLFSNIYFTLFAGLPWGKARMGSFSTLTAAVSVDRRSFQRQLIDVDWLAGGFVLSWKQDLVKHNYYPFKGKAYCEDLLHSKERHRKGIKHHVATKVLVFTTPSERPENLNGVIKEIKGRFRVAKYLGCNRYRAYMFLALELARLYLASCLKIEIPPQKIDTMPKA